MKNLAAYFLITFGPIISVLAQERPNIILILVGDMGWSNIGCYGGMVEIPNIDRLAADGVRFDQFYSLGFNTPKLASAFAL